MKNLICFTFDFCFSGKNKTGYTFASVPTPVSSFLLDEPKRNNAASPQVPVDVRLDKFKEKAVPLVSDVARRAIKEAGLNVSDISKLVVVSSTGFLGPGLDCELIKNLGLTRSVDRTLIGFMGCAAAMNGFRNANDYVTVSFILLPSTRMFSSPSSSN